MATVWVPHPVKDDLSTALVYGQLRYITDRFVYADEISDELEIPNYFLDRYKSAAQQFDPENDYMLLAGDHLQMVLFSAALSSFHSKFRLLRYDRIARGYFEVEIPTW